MLNLCGKRFWILLLACAHLPLWADGPQTGTIDGRVLDAQGQGLPGATVTLAGPQGKKTAITGPEGKYRFSLLLDGSFSLSAELEGLGKAEASTVLDAGQRRSVDLSLRAGTAEAITVVAEAPLVNKYETASTATIDAEVLEALSFSTRYSRDNIVMLPGAVKNQSNSLWNSFSGGRATDVLSFVEGVDVSQPVRGGEFRVAMPTTAIAQTTLQTAGMGAEYGRASNAQVNQVVKTGTNQFHGEAIWMIQNASWRDPYANAPFSEIPLPDELINNYELSLGGPIYRNRAWFFVAHSKISENRWSALPDGQALDRSEIADPLLTKLNFQPGAKHQLAVTHILSPYYVQSNSGNPGDVFAANSQERDNSVFTASWNFAIAPSVFLELKAGENDNKNTRVAEQYRVVDPNASPDNPLGNPHLYIDQATNTRYNANSHPVGDGQSNSPRQQLNAAVSIFRGSHDIRVGADRHETLQRSTREITTQYRGRGYDESLPGGFVTPTNKRVFAQPMVTPEVSGTMGTVFVQDRIDIGERWVLTAGLRLEDQSLENNFGEKVNDYSKLAPRLTAVYDINADGSLLLRATAGRYYNAFGLNLPFNSFFQGPNGANKFDQFRFNPATGLYDRFQRTVDNTANREAQESLDPEFQDAFSLGVDWQISGNWVGKAHVEYRDNKEVWSVSTQWDAAGQPVFDLRTWTAGEAQRVADGLGVPSPGPLFREHTGLVLELNRRMRNNWAVRSNLAWNDTRGNVSSRVNRDATFDGLGGLEVGTGVPDLTSRFTGGRIAGGGNAEYILNLVGIKRWEIGKHSLNAGAYFNWTAGQFWGRTAAATIFHPVSLETLQVTTLLEPSDSHQLPDLQVLNLNLSWTFPIKGALEGQLGAELSNALNEDTQIGINTRTGLPTNGISSFVLPRELRLNAAIRF